MAEEDAEIALLHQLQAGQDSMAWENGGADEVAEGELPSNTEHEHNNQVKKEAVADDQVLRALSPSGAGAVPDDGDEYDPSSVTSLPAVAIADEEGSRSSSRASTRKPKTVGGFIADDSDEDSDTSTPGQASASLLQPPASNNSKRAPSPLQTSVSHQDLQGTPENQGDSTATPHSSHTLSVNPSSAGLPSVQAPATQVLTSAGTSSQNVPAPKARLPNDRTGILEDKIKEDPRGALDSWLALINEHKSRNKLDDARAVYDRFFKVFPQSVSISLLLLNNALLT
jgi:cleavage stimulation factor subunit 3